MASDSRHLQLDRIIGPFADLLLAADMPKLPAERRARAVQFVERRATVVPSFTRFGITVIGLLFRALIVVPGGGRIACFVAGRSIPIVGEYPRLIRSLGYAYVWEQWPDTLPDGSPR